MSGDRNAPQIIATRDTPQGKLSIYAKCPPGFFSDLRLDSGIGNFALYSSIIQKLEEFEKRAAEKDGRVALAVVEENLIVGYFVCGYPKQDDRWSKLGNLMYELGAVEVSRNFRKHGIARLLIESIVREPFIEDKIAYMVGYSWSWDVDGSGYTVSEYRNVHFKLLGPHGFQEYYTNEGNISIREENILMARIGNRVSSEDEKSFKRLLYGVVS